MDDNRKFTETGDREYKGDDITVYWKPSACIHASSCYRELIEVFDPGSRPWVNMKGAPTDRIIETVNLCPTEALSWKWNDESKNNDISPGHTNHIKYRRPELYDVPAQKEQDTRVTVKIMPEGPVLIEGDFTIITDDNRTDVKDSLRSFCRCGSTNTPPYCDGEHRISAFRE